MMSMSRSLDFFSLAPGVFLFVATVWFTEGLRLACSVFCVEVEAALLDGLCGSCGCFASARPVRSGFSFAAGCAVFWSVVPVFWVSSRIVAARGVAGMAGEAGVLMLSVEEFAGVSLGAAAPVGGVEACWVEVGFASAGAGCVADRVAIQ